MLFQQQGLSVGCGMAYCGKHLDKAPYRTYVLMGDGEAAEGNVWEAMTFAGYYGVRTFDRSLCGKQYCYSTFDFFSRKYSKEICIVHSIHQGTE